jgi:hypothetical protein
MIVDTYPHRNCIAKTSLCCAFFLAAFASDEPAHVFCCHCLRLNVIYVHVSSFAHTLMPWTTEYGSTRVPLHTQLTNMDSINFDAFAWHMRNPSSTPPTSQHIEIEISGIPPHLCSNVTIHRLLDGIYDIQWITFMHSNITYWVLTHTHIGPSCYP